LLYSTKVKLFPWIPEFVVNFLTSKALTEVGIQSKSTIYLLFKPVIVVVGYALGKERVRTGGYPNQVETRFTYFSEYQDGVFKMV